MKNFCLLLLLAHLVITVTTVRAQPGDDDDDDDDDDDRRGRRPPVRRRQRILSGDDDDDDGPPFGRFPLLKKLLPFDDDDDDDDGDGIGPFGFGGKLQEETRKFLLKNVQKIKDIFNAPRGELDCDLLADFKAQIPNREGFAKRLSFLCPPKLRECDEWTEFTECTDNCNGVRVRTRSCTCKLCTDTIPIARYLPCVNFDPTAAKDRCEDSRHATLEVEPCNCE